MAWLCVSLVSPSGLLTLLSLPERHVKVLLLFAGPALWLLQLLSEMIGHVPNTSSVRLVNASVRGADASMLASALLQCGSLRTLQLHQVRGGQWGRFTFLPGTGSTVLGPCGNQQHIVFATSCICSTSAAALHSCHSVKYVVSLKRSLTEQPLLGQRRQSVLRWQSV